MHELYAVLLKSKAYDVWWQFIITPLRVWSNEELNHSMSNCVLNCSDRWEVERGS